MKTIKILLCCLPWVVATAYAADELNKGEWWIQVTVTSEEAGGMKDARNYLGWFRDSEDGKDQRDLQELAPFSAPTLTIVFPHSDWGADAADYTADFRSVKRKGKEVWDFEVRSDRPGRVVTLSWQGDANNESKKSDKSNKSKKSDKSNKSNKSSKSNKLWKDMHLVDVENRDKIRVTRKGEMQTYRLTMPGTVHRFQWVKSK